MIGQAGEPPFFFSPKMRDIHIVKRKKRTPQVRAKMAPPFFLFGSGCFSAVGFGVMASDRATSEWVSTVGLTA